MTNSTTSDTASTGETTPTSEDASTGETTPIGEAASTGSIATTDTQTVDSLAVVGGQVVTPETVIEGGIRIEGDRIVEVGDVDTDADRVIDANGRYVLPGLIDLHGDDIEGHLHPRSGARMSTPMALASADRANVAAGITTKFHAISFELDEDADRSPELAAELTGAITAANGLLVDHRLHARCEVTQPECVEAVLAVVENGDADLVSVMSHIPGKGQFRNIESFREYYAESTDHTVEEADRIIEKRGDVPMSTIRKRVQQVIERAHDAGAVTASHDDEDPEEVARLADVGVDITEYPITMATAERAAERGMNTAMGAPNLVRGESQWGNLATVDAIEAGVVDILVADYHPPSLLAGAFVETGEPLADRIRRVTATPADAIGFADRGRLEAGKRADLVVVDSEPTPTVTQAIVGGQPVYRADGTLGGKR
ncbi:alpha-D-ribose 1-methylphosphonate 5-triphosphate diphosphatase [Halohasta litchfieldiae]|jgi:alpha-D-ribose 1-methylphosphonate 5-triphosphate diphosphatase|uniref:Alpha-D-ribose 1-methylphosphonate 5-triphosphate diphosphatase n=1 Tax=Halohasta litchfieldiae TaxID=1073996 RepID=A0A1H6XE13_9EURY|nr:alpha-D-ribose 1-methylphosphonate 5-triphosphate diphosphatase [Halohasta litchfieldiae]ATW88118.1 alpha-D-ribose 1-methylphosphonate 5-triphosphate diphosphatase [Halohasta litchfieldiae]SEJ23130.1 alpha-D-ribose 1-methylphosphonate 5-triphosphate diphosphatase [Halohasta litchfieldiae]